MIRLLKFAAAYIKGHKTIFLTGTILGFVVVFIGVNIFGPYLKSRPQEIVIGRTGNITLQTLPEDLQEKISLGLTKTLPDGTATPSAALSWTATDSGKTYTFKLNPGLFWHNKKPFLAKDVNYQLQDVKITAKAPDEVEFVLANPFSPLPVIVSQPLFQSGLTGLGEYRLANFKLSGRFVDSLSLEKPGQKLTYKFYATDKQTLTALKLGKIQVTEGIINRRDAPDLPFWAATNFSRQAVIFFNTKDPLFSEKNLRQALNYALPDTGRFGQKSFGPISPNSWAYNSNLKKYPQDFETAKSLLSKIQASQSGRITLTAIPELKPVAELVKNSWKNLDLNVDISVSDVIPGSYQALLTYLDTPKDPDQYLLWHSTSVQNITGYKSPKSDKLLEEGRQALDIETRKTKYFDFQKAVTEDVPAAFLYFPTVYTVTRK